MKTSTFADKPKAMASVSRAGAGLAICGRSPWYGTTAMGLVVNAVFVDHQIRARRLEESSQ
jgi:hypothetical protein